MRLWVLFAACGACHFDGQIEATPDAGPDHASLVTLTIQSGGAPAGHVTVYFQDLASSLVLATTTDEHGIAAAALPTSGFVTVVVPHVNPDAIDSLTTFADVRPGDQLQLELAPPSTVSSATLAVTVPIDQAHAAAAAVLYSSCSEPTNVVPGLATPIVFVGCNGIADVMVVEADANGAPFGAIYEAGVAVGDQKSATLDGPYQAFVATTFDYTNVPASVTWINTFQALTSSHGRVFGTGAGHKVSSGSASVAFAQAPAAGTALTVSDGFPASAEFGEQLVYDWQPNTPGATYALDYATATLPAYAAAPAFDPATHAIAWSERSGTLAPDFVRSQILASRTDRTWRWAMISARTLAPMAALPQLPLGVFDFNVAAGDSVAIERLTNAVVPGGYDAARAHGFEPITQAIAGASGRVVIEDLYTAAL